MLSCSSIEREIGYRYQPLILLVPTILFRIRLWKILSRLSGTSSPLSSRDTRNVSRIGGCIHFIIRSHDRWNALSLIYDRVVETVHDCFRRNTVKKLNRYAGGTVTAVWCELLRVNDEWLEEIGADREFRGKGRKTILMLLCARNVGGQIFKWNATIAWNVNGGKSLYVRWAKLGGGQHEPSATGNENQGTSANLRKSGKYTLGRS